MSAAFGAGAIPSGVMPVAALAPGTTTDGSCRGFPRPPSAVCGGCVGCPGVVPFACGGLAPCGGFVHGCCPAGGCSGCTPMGCGAPPFAPLEYIPGNAIVACAGVSAPSVTLPASASGCVFFPGTAAVGSLASEISPLGPCNVPKKVEVDATSVREAKNLVQVPGKSPKNASVGPVGSPATSIPADSKPQEPRIATKRDDSTDLRLQETLLEDQQEKEQLMQLQMQVTQAVVQKAMANKQASDQETIMQQQYAFMQQSDAASQQKQQQEQQQMQQMQQQQQQQQMQQHMLQQQMMQQQMMMQSGMMGPCGMAMGGPMMPSGPTVPGFGIGVGMGVGMGLGPAPNIDLDKRYVGVIKSFNKEKGIGLVDSAELKDKFGTDVFLHASQMQSGEQDGDVISFKVQVGKLGQPRAKEIQVVGNLQDPDTVAMAQDDSLSVRYIGTLKSYNLERGFGFIFCAETYDKFGSDVFLHKEQTPEKLAVGDGVGFSLRLSQRGQPQAKDVEKVEASNASAKASAPPPFKPVSGIHADAPGPYRAIPHAKANNGLPLSSAAGIPPGSCSFTTPPPPPPIPNSGISHVS